MTEYVNNHIHTTYSFSPYTPEAAAKKAKQSGLVTAGIMDHDSVGGAFEFIEAGAAEGIATTVGFECRVRMAATPFGGMRLNNPDQLSVAYVACHGIPHQHIETAQAWLAPYRDLRNIRNRSMVDRINGEVLKDTGLKIDFDTDVAGISMYKGGGSITERHITYALVNCFLDNIGAGGKLIKFLEGKIGLSLSEKQRAALQNTGDPYYDYTLLGILKSGMIGLFYIDATDECPTVREFLGFVISIGAIPAYAYLGDVTNSVTGDKKAQQFEDSFIGELVPWLKKEGFLALTFMPTRNTKEQLARVMGLCDEHGLFQISGEDINSPTQSFRCEALRLPEYKHLVTSTWALIGHEATVSKNLEDGMFSERTIRETPGLPERIERFAKIGRAAGGK